MSPSLEKGKAPAETKEVYQLWRKQSVGSHQSGEEAKRSQLEGAKGQDLQQCACTPPHRDRKRVPTGAAGEGGEELVGERGDTGISYQADFPYLGKATLGPGASGVKLMCVSSFLGSL